MRYSIRTVTALDEIIPVLSIDEAKAHLRVLSDDEDALIDAFVLAAQDHVERHTSRLLTPRDMEFVCRGFPCAGGAIVIPRDPITEISEIVYVDTDGEEATLEEADWRWSESMPDQVLPAFGESWATATDELGSVRVSFAAGYDEGLCPAALVQAVRLLLGTLYAQRESVVAGNLSELPGGVLALCAPYRRLAL